MIEAPQSLENYSIVCNEVAKRTDLSARAKGIYYYLATLPSNWKLSQQECMTHFTEGKDAFRTAFQELVDSGYIVKYQTSNEFGQFSGYEYKVIWSVCDGGKPVAEKPKTDKPKTDKPKQYITDYNNYKLDKLKIKESKVSGR